MNKFPLYFSDSIFSLSKDIRDHRKVKRSFSKVLWLFLMFYSLQLTSLAGVPWGLRKCNDSTNDFHDWWTFWQMLLSTKPWLLWAQVSGPHELTQHGPGSQRKVLVRTTSNISEPNVGGEKPSWWWNIPSSCHFYSLILLKQKMFSKFPILSQHTPGGGSTYPISGITQSRGAATAQAGLGQWDEHWVPGEVGCGSLDVLRPFSSCFSGGDLCPDDHLQLLSYLQLIFLGKKIKVLQPSIGALLWANHVDIGDRKQPGEHTSHSMCLRTSGWGQKKNPPASPELTAKW